MRVWFQGWLNRIGEIFWQSIWTGNNRKRRKRWLADSVTSINRSSNIRIFFFAMSTNHSWKKQDNDAADDGGGGGSGMASKGEASLRCDDWHLFDTIRCSAEGRWRAQRSVHTNLFVIDRMLFTFDLADGGQDATSRWVRNCELMGGGRISGRTDGRMFEDGEVCV